MNNSNREWWLAWALTAISAAVSLGFASEAFVDRDAGESTAAYAAVRSLALFLAVLSVALVPAFRARGPLLVVAGAMVVVQLLDGFVGIGLHDAVRTYGPFATAAANAVVAWPVLRVEPHPSR